MDKTREQLIEEWERAVQHAYGNWRKAPSLSVALLELAGDDLVTFIKDNT